MAEINQYIEEMIENMKREIVEKILVRLFIKGKMQEDHLPERDLQKEVAKYFLKNKISNFPYQDISEVMVKNCFCHFMRKEMTHKVTYFHMNIPEIKKLAEKHAKSVSQEVSAEANEQGSANDPYFDLKYMLSIKQDRMKNFTIEEEPIKPKRKRALQSLVERKPLRHFYPSKDMKYLTQNHFESPYFSEEQKCLLMKINDFLHNGVTESNYVMFWKTLIEMEDCSDAVKISKFDKVDQNLTVEKEFYVLQFSNLSDESPITKGTGVALTLSSLRYRHCQDRQTIYARVHQVRRDNIVLDLEDKHKIEPDCKKEKKKPTFQEDALYDVRFMLNRMTMQMQMIAITYVNVHKISKFFFPDTIPTHPIDFVGFEWVNESVKSNPEQQIAIKHIVGKSSFPAPYILMGPPGTGKTTTIVEAVCQIIKRNPEARILVAANSNCASDVIALRLLEHLPKTSVYRMYSSSKERDLNTIDPILVAASNLSYGCHYYPCLKDLAKYHVILTTLTIAGKFSQAKIQCKHFSYVFIDESGSCTEPSTLIPIAGVISSIGEIHGQVILAGDPMQLGPVVMSDKAKTRLGVSLLERLIDTGIYTRDPTTGKYNPRVLTKLLRNFRSHPKILEFPNDVFYGGELMARASHEVTRWACGWEELPNKMIPIVFEHVVGQTKRDRNSPSMYNLEEIDRVMFRIEKLLNSEELFERKITQKCIGVVTPYKKQCQKILDRCQRKNWCDIEVGSVEKFQGQEKPVIILSTVRSQTRGVGFLNNPKRLNVALTRAQALLIVVGNIITLEKDPTWREFIKFCRDNNLVKQVLEEKHIVPRKKKMKKKAKKTCQKKSPDEIGRLWWISMRIVD